MERGPRKQLLGGIANPSPLYSRNPRYTIRTHSVEGTAYWKQAVGVYDTLRLCRLCTFLLQRQPDDNVGYSILIYRLTAEDVKKAIWGPPVELDKSLTRDPRLHVDGESPSDSE